MLKAIRWFLATILLFVAANAGLEHHSLPVMKNDFVSWMVICITAFSVGLLVYKDNEYD